MMTTGILDALMRLFALFAAGRSSREAMLGRQAASRYLTGRLSWDLSEQYLKRYDQILSELNQRLKPSADEDVLAKRKSKLSVRLLRVCNQIKMEMELRDRLVVFVRLAEFAKSTGTIDDADSFLQTVGETLHLKEEDVEELKRLVKFESVHEIIWSEPFFQIPFGHLEENSLLVACKVSLDDVFFIKDFGAGDLRLNGMPIPSGSCVAMAQGSVLKDSSGHVVFFSDLLQLCHSCHERHNHVSFNVQDVAHFFAYPNEPALRPVSLSANAGQLVGIMGASGSGKSTLLNILNGSQKPTFGRVQLNGYSMYEAPDFPRGLIGHIAQEDVLISELTVEENLTFSAKLSLGNESETDISDRVERTLKRLGLWEIKDLRVGSLLDKTISGGQRKRLNIGLELIREPAVLFVDEPTSGLSSRDSEHIMDLLKELTLRGKLIFVVIHQPSSDIFKLFDNLLLLDTGGFPIYQGNPLESLTYFKQLSNQIQATESMCNACGTINPEMIFEIVESCMVDEFGQMTNQRRISSEEWNDYYNLVIHETKNLHESRESLPQTSKTPSWRKQWAVYWKRDLRAKRSNRQYVWMNLLQAPILALALALFTRYRDGSDEYAYRLSENLPQFLFISVIVALFLGLSFSAEEIFRDRPTLRRERFLSLNWNAYLSSKMTMMFGISAVQSLFYTLISIWILDIPNALGIMFFTFFSLSCFASVLGLSLSSAMKSAKNIYIMIPLLIIPQIIFGGAIIRYDRFNPIFTQVDRVPLIGNLMASRWGFESIAVHLTRENEADAPFVEIEDRLERSAWRRDFWCNAYDNLESDHDRQLEWVVALEELASWGIPSDSILDSKEIKSVYKEIYKQAFSERDSLRSALAEVLDLKELKDHHHNESLYSWVMQTDRNRRVILTKRGLVQETAFIHQMPLGRQAWNAPFYAPFKQIGNWIVSTPIFNTLMLWLMIACFYLLLANKVPERIGWGRRLQ